MKNLFYLFLFAVLSVSCGSNVNIFGNKTPHRQYEEKIDDTPAGREWLAVSKKVLASPQTIQLPYRHQGNFPNDKSRALALMFTVKQGERVHVELDKQNNSEFVLYADLYLQDGDELSHLYAADIDSTRFNFDAEETGSYIIRLQPEINGTGLYSLNISTGPSLGFPVSGHKARTGSFWGDDRDGGKRSHEGIDIFAPKLTPAVAAADGYITSVRDGGLGGKTVSLRPTGKKLSLYYAHLDKQLVEEGQFVKKGEVVGLVGNTGNAKHTPAHLHFGIYTYDGAIDPFPFVNQTVKTAPALPNKEMSGYLKLLKAQKSPTGSLAEVNTVLIPLAVTSKNFIAELPDGTIIQAPFNAVKLVKEREQQKTTVTSSEGTTKKS